MARRRPSTSSSDGDCEAWARVFEEELSAVLPDDVDSLRNALCSLNPLAHSALRSVPPPSAEARNHKLMLRRGFENEQYVKRVYVDDAPCSVLLVSFCSLTQPDDCQFEWAGAARRAARTHTLFLTDPLQAWYLRSSADPDVDPFASTLAVIVGEIQSLAAPRVVCIGASMGGYAAARCGLALGALDPARCPTLVSTLVLAFGPQCFINPSERVALSLPWMSFDDALDRLARVASARTHAFPLHSLAALAAAGAAAASGRAEGAERSHVRLELHVGSAALGDVREARLLEESVTMLVDSLAAETPSRALGVNVDVRVHATADERSGHCVAAALKADGLLDGLIASRLDAWDTACSCAA